MAFDIRIAVSGKDAAGCLSRQPALKASSTSAAKTERSMKWKGADTGHAGLRVENVPTEAA